VGTAFVAHEEFLSRLGDHLVFLAFLPAALLAGWFGGLGPGLMALMLGFALGDFFFLPPRFEFVPRGAPEFASLMVYFFTGLFGIAIIVWHHRVRLNLELAHAHRQALEREVHERQEVEEALRKSEQELRLAQDALRLHAATLERHVAERTESLKETVTALENVLYHVAHDLRAPVRAMHGFSELLLENYGGQVDPVGKDYAQRIEEACRTMDALTSDLLEHGRLGYQKIELSPVDLTPLFERLLRSLADEIKSRGAAIELNKPLSAVVADSGVLEQVLMNLLTNSLKFVAEGKSPQVHIWTETGAGLVRINIRDEGIGIAPEYREKIFGVFERLHQNGSYPGTGIGLAIVKRGVERLGGRFGVESEVGRGSRFWLELPQSPSPA
jgi:signal transduction histidine kinase